MLLGKALRYILLAPLQRTSPTQEAAYVGFSLYSLLLGKAGLQRILSTQPPNHLAARHVALRLQARQVQCSLIAGVVLLSGSLVGQYVGVSPSIACTKLTEDIGGVATTP